MTANRHAPKAQQSRLSTLEVLILGLFFASGASALVYEVVWSRLLTYTFGGSAFAIATVLAAYMGGLALGSLWFGKRIDRQGHPLIIYGILEGIIGLWALLLPSMLGGLDTLYGSLYQSTNMGVYPLSLIRFVFCFLLLLVPTTMMGGTLPVLGKLLLKNWQGLGARAGLLYGTNTLGAVLGVFCAGFIIVPAWGLRGTTYLAVVVNLLIMAIAFMLSRRFPYQRVAEQAPVETRGFSIPKDPVKRAVLLVYAASGFAALSYEVAWTKVLSMILGTTTYAFASMLTTFLFALAVGAFIFGKLADRFGRPEGLLVWVQLSIPIFALATIPILEALPQIWVDTFPSLEGSWIKLEAFRFLLAAAAMAIPALLMGGTFPLVTRIFVEKKSVGSTLGTLYASNTLGAILGSFLTGFILIPVIGRQNSILAATLVNLLAAGVLVYTLRRNNLPRMFHMVTVLLVVALIPMALRASRPWDKTIMSSGAYYYPKDLGKAPSIKEHLKESNLLFYKESTDAAISVWRTLHVTSLRMNGKIDASSHTDMRTQKLIAHLPFIYHRNTDQETVLIGLASGITAGSMLTYPLKSLDVVELVEGVDEAAKFFSDYNGNCLEDPRFNLIVNDGRNQLKLSPKTYDIIVSQPTNPWIAGVGALFTREFFELTKERLNPGGIACVWVQMYHMQDTEIKAVLGTFTDAFEEVDLWMGTRGDLILIGSRQPLSWDWDYYTHVYDADPGEDLKSFEILSPESIFSFYVTQKSGLKRYIGDVSKRVTDDNLLLEYGIPRHMFQGEGEISAYDLVPFFTPPKAMIHGASPQVLAETGRYQKGHGDALGAFFGVHPSGLSPEAVYRSVLEQTPYEVLAREVLSKGMNERGIKQLQDGNIQQARAVFTEVLPIATRDEAALALNNLGYIAFAEGNVDSAEAYWNRAITLEPYLASTIYNLGLLAAQAGDHSRAAELYQRAAQIDTYNGAAHNNAAYHLALSGENPSRALALAQRAVDLERIPEHLDTLGFILIQKEAFSQAESVLLEAIAADSGYHEAWYHLGQAQLGNGDRTQAKRSLQEVVDRAQDPDLVSQARALLQNL